LTRIRKKRFFSIGKEGPLPPFFLPIVAFVVWFLAILPYVTILRFDFYLSDQLIAAYYFISYLVLLFAWVLSGPTVAAVLSFLFSAVSLYIFLVTKEPAFLLELFFYAVFYLSAVSFLSSVQKKNNNRQIVKEKLTEDIHWTQAEASRKDVLKTALNKKIDRLMNLREFSEELKVVKDVQTASQRIVKEAYEILGKADACILYLVNESQQQLSLVAGQSSNDAIVKETNGTVFDQWVMKKAKGLLIADTANDFRFSAEPLTTASRPRSVCANPMMTGNKVLGVVSASAMKPGIFNTEDLRLLDIFSDLGSVTLKNLLLHARMEEMATHDGLTGLYLNRYFKERFSEEWRSADDRRGSFALIMMDVDFFKKCNDTYGHSAGDIVLKNIASIIRSCLDFKDCAARYGGEEFIVLLPDKNKKEAMAVAEQIRSKIEAHPFVFRRIKARTTVSLGVVAYPEKTGTDEALLRMADEALYRAKSLGRNRVCGDL